MKTKLLILLLLTQYLGFSQTILSENIGSSPTTALIAAYTGWQNNGVFIFSGTGDVRNTTPSSGYGGASGNGNIFLTNTVGKNFQISGINTSSYSSIILSVGIFKSTITGNGSDLKIEVSSDGVTYSALSYVMSTGTGTAKWYLISPTGTIPSTSNLRIRFTQTGTTTQYRIDDVVLYGTSVLPIELIYFNAVQAENKVQIDWLTATELDNDFFVIDKSTDGMYWKEIIKIEGQGTVSTPTLYKEYDSHPSPGYNYYRLKQIDYNEFERTLEIVFVYCKDKSIKLEKYVDVLGREIVDLEKYSGMYLVIFEDGTIEKRIKN